MPGQGRRWRPPNISSLCAGAGRLGADPLHMLFEQVAGPTGADGAPGCSAAGCGWCRWTAPPPTCRTARRTTRIFGRPSNATRDGAFPQVRWVAAAESGTGALVGATIGPYTVGEQTLALDLLHCVRPGDAGAGRPELPVLHPGPRRAGHRGAHPVAGLGVVPADADQGAGRRQLPGPAAPAPQGRRPRSRCGSSSTPCTPPRRRRRPRSPRRCSAWSPTCSTPRRTRRWTWRAATRCGGAARP